MAQGITPARGDWEYRRSAISGLAQAAFNQGDLVGLDHTRLVSVWTSTRSNWLGVAMHDSADSLPAGSIGQIMPKHVGGVDPLLFDRAERVHPGTEQLNLFYKGRVVAVDVHPKAKVEIVARTTGRRRKKNTYR